MSNLTSWYQEQIDNGSLKPDLAQKQLFNELQLFLNSFSKQNFITRLFSKNNKLGYYIYGDVGRGKSMIMNAMFQCTQTPRKLRKHFHEFMRDIHSQLAILNIDDPVIHITQELKKNYDIIYLDEMHISDIATAMIMKKLLDGLFKQNIYIVTSSNYHPDGLWPNGLMRERFLPAIETIKQWLNISCLNSKQDYRLINHSFNELFIINKPNANNLLEEIFQSVNLKNEVHYGALEICSRELPTIKFGNNCVWLDFSIICGNMRSQLDYIELSKQFEWIFISDVYQLSSEQKDIARRFTWLIDVLYDESCKVALTSKVPIYDIYNDGDFANEFTRTISRLEEMQTQEYLEKS